MSYADMITLLFCLFLILYAMSKVNEQKFQQLSRSLSTAIQHANLDDPTPEPAASVAEVARQLEASGEPQVNHKDVDNAKKMVADKRREEERLRAILHRLGAILSANGWRDAVQIHLEEAGLVVTLLTDGLVFDLGDAEVRRTGIPLILAVAAAVRPFPNQIRVEGHTDTIPLHGGPYKTNWGLSTMRATNVAEVLIRGGRLNPRRLSVLGYGETRPKVPNDTAINRQRNRRVEILIMRGSNTGEGVR